MAIADEIKRSFLAVAGFAVFGHACYTKGLRDSSMQMPCNCMQLQCKAMQGKERKGKEIKRKRYIKDNVAD